jgi:2,4-dienoyl-CoA reductase-like NADH-dependent reductase (Old Yellow Enzyme family)
MSYPRIGAFKSVDQFRERLAALGLELPCDDAPLSAAEGSPLAEPLQIGEFTVGNRWCVHPMEGWDGTADGRPSEHTVRRWQHFGESGCKLIWGGEAFAVQEDGRANPNQLYYGRASIEHVERLRDTLFDAHRARFGPDSDADLFVGLQLTHSGRYARPHLKDRPEPRIAYHHPLLDRRVGIEANDDSRVWTDGEIRDLIDQYIAVARLADAAGFHFVDIKACHGYLGHEFLSAYERPGPYGGDFEGRTRFLREIIAGVRAECPPLKVGVRLSLFDSLPYRPDPARSSPGKLGPGIPEEHAGREYPGFGCRRDDPLQIDLREPIELIRVLRRDYGVALFNLSAGSPYYNPHLQRPAYYPPSDGYQPPEDPLVGCVRQIHAVREVKRGLPGVPIVGTAYTYFQEFLPHVAQAVVRAGWVDSVGIGRLVLSDWDLPAKLLAGNDYRAAKKICRTFSDCTTAPRNGLISGCYPLDESYKGLPEAEILKRLKRPSAE